MNEQRAVRNRKMILTNENLDTEEDVNNNKQNNIEAKINRNADKVREEMQLEKLREQAKELGLEPYSNIPKDAATSERDNFVETEEETYKRMHIEQYSKHSDGLYTLMYIRKIVIIAIICGLVISPFIKSLSGKLISEANIDIGNPYNCMSCRYKNSACTKHKDYETVGRPKYLREKIDNLVYTKVYENNRNEDDIKYSYYNSNEYDTTCDFCNEKQSECDGCKYTRLRLEEIVDNKYKEILKSGNTIKTDELTLEEINFLKQILYKELDCDI